MDMEHKLKTMKANRTLKIQAHNCYKQCCKIICCILSSRHRKKGPTVTLLILNRLIKHDFFVHISDAKSIFPRLALLWRFTKVQNRKSFGKSKKKLN